MSTDDEWTRDYGDVSEDIAPKDPTQINADDLLAGEVTVLITGFKRYKREKQPWEIRLDGYPVPWRPCRTMRRAIVRAWGKGSRAYLGRRMTLYRKDDVTFKGDEVGGIRISHFSHIRGTFTVFLQKNQQTKQPWTFHPLKTPQDAARTQDRPNAAPMDWDGFRKALGDRYDAVDRYHAETWNRPLEDLLPADWPGLLAHIDTPEGRIAVARYQEPDHG